MTRARDRKLSLGNWNPTLWAAKQVESLRESLHREHQKLIFLETWVLALAAKLNDQHPTKFLAQREAYFTDPSRFKLSLDAAGWPMLTEVQKPD